VIGARKLWLSASIALNANRATSFSASRAMVQMPIRKMYRMFYYTFRLVQSLGAAAFNALLKLGYLCLFGRGFACVVNL